MQPRAQGNRQPRVAGDDQRQAAGSADPRDREAECEAPGRAVVTKNDSGDTARQPGDGRQRVWQPAVIGEQPQGR
jgi:hypothetical protein